MDDNKQAKVKVDIDNVSIFSRPWVKFGILVAVIVITYVVYLAYSYSIKRNECAAAIVFRPATESVPPSNNYGHWYKDAGLQGKSEHYTYDRREFRTRSEAIDYCVSKK